MNSDQVIVAKDKDNLEEKETNFENFIKLQQQQLFFIKSNPDMSTLSTPMTVDVDELFQLLEENFDTYHNSANLKDLLPFIHLNLSRFVRLEHGKHDIGLVLYNFYNEHKESEGDISIVVQIIHQVLHSLNIYGNKEISVASKV